MINIVCCVICCSFFNDLFACMLKLVCDVSKLVCDVSKKNRSIFIVGCFFFWGGGGGGGGERSGSVVECLT